MAKGHNVALCKRIADNVMGWKWSRRIYFDPCCNLKHMWTALLKAEEALEGMCIGFFGKFDLDDWTKSERSISFPKWHDSYYFMGELTPLHITTAIDRAYDSGVAP